MLASCCPSGILVAVANIAVELHAETKALCKFNDRVTYLESMKIELFFDLDKLIL
jgi:hypothetical protein